MRHPWRSTRARRRTFDGVAGSASRPVSTTTPVRGVSTAAPEAPAETAAALAEIRARLDSLVGPAAVSERHPECVRAGCSDLNPCLPCQETYAERLRFAELDRQAFRRYAAADVAFLLPVVEALVADGGGAAVARLEQELARRAPRA